VAETPHSALPDLVAFSEGFLERFPEDSAQGVGDLRGDADTGHRVMLEMIRERGTPVTLLDFGCGLSRLNDVLVREGPSGVTYVGLDVSDRFLEASRQRYPSVTYLKKDVLAEDIDDLPEFDYIVMNGILTYRGERTDEEMWAYLRALVTRLFPQARRGLAFNMHSKQVDWEREDLFHVALDPLVSWLSRAVSRHVVIRADYGLYDFTAYVYRHPSDPERAGARRTLRGVDEDAPGAGAPGQSSSPAR
jgi:SAM-dependent methyltransferase